MEAESRWHRGQEEEAITFFPEYIKHAGEERFFWTSPAYVSQKFTKLFGHPFDRESISYTQEEKLPFLPESIYQREQRGRAAAFPARAKSSADKSSETRRSFLIY